MARKLEVEIVGDASSLKRALGVADSSSSKLGGTFGRLAKGGLLAAGAAGVGALIYTLKTGIGEFTASQKVAAQTNAVIKSTGGVAKVSAKEVSDLAESLMKKSGIDDEAIASGENLLLSFTKIRNEVGKGNDIFNQATKATLDLSVAMGKDMQSSSVLVGKALNDPIKGLTALTRVGVSFTDGQKAAIKRMVELGDTAGAQKLILKELNKEFGGSAEALGKTLPGQINIVKERFNNWAGEMVAKTIPVLKQTIAWLKDHWPEIRAKVMEMWAAVQPSLVAFGELVGTVAGLVKKHWGTIGPIVQVLADRIKIAFQIIADVIQIITALLRGDWATAWNEVKDLVGHVLDLVVNIVEQFKLTIVALMKRIGVEMKNALVAGLVGIGNAAMNVLRNIGEAITSNLTQFRNWGRNLGESIKNGVVSGVTGVASAAWEIISGLGGYIAARLGQVVGWGRELGSSLLSGIKAALVGIGAYVAGLVKSAVNVVIGRINALLEFTIDTHIPGVGKVRFDAPDIHPLAKGGIVTKPTLAFLGESGPEAVVPLGGGAAGLAPMQINVVLPNGEALASVLFDPLRNKVTQLRAQGGTF